jgi:antitoxin YefM
MTHVSYSELRRNLAHYMDEAIESRAPIVITRRSGQGSVVMLSEEEFEGWRETLHLLSSPRNAARLMQAIQELDAGKGQERELLPASP